MKKAISVDLGHGYFTKVNSDIFNRLELRRYSWRAQVHKSGKVYATGSREGMSFAMHRVILNAGKGQHVDHRDGDGLNNQIDNLRLCTPAQNRANSRCVRHSSAGFKGIAWSASSRKWMAQITVNKRKYYLGMFEHKERAAMAYDRAAIHYHGEFAGLNFPERQERYYKKSVVVGSGHYPLVRPKAVIYERAGLMVMPFTEMPRTFILDAASGIEIKPFSMKETAPLFGHVLESKPQAETS